MLISLVAGALWLYVLWYSYESYSGTRNLSRSIITMLHLLRVGICEKRKSIAEIITEEGIFAENEAKDFSAFLWENHEILGIAPTLIDSYNDFCRESAMSSGQACEDGIKVIEKEFREAIGINEDQLRSKYVSFVTLCTAVFAIITILTV